MKIYVTGASGRLGAAVIKFIPNAIPVNLRDENIDLKELFSDATHIIHLAGSLKFSNKTDLWKGNYELTKKVVAATPLKARIIHASSISVYGKKLAEIPANEETRCYPDSEYAKSKYAAEQEITRHPNYIALRIAAIYGPGIRDYFKMMDILAGGKMFLVGDGNNYIPFVHIDDVVRAIKNALNYRIPPGVYLLSSDPITQKKIYEVVCNQLCIPRPKFKLNKYLAIGLLSATGLIRKLLGKGDFLTLEHINILANNRIFDCSKAEKYLKFKPRSVEDGIKEMARAYLAKKSR